MTGSLKWSGNELCKVGEVSQKTLETDMVCRLRRSGALVKPPCGAYFSRVGAERQGQGVSGRLYD